jgi:hypothetical protein
MDRGFDEDSGIWGLGLRIGEKLRKLIGNSSERMF